ncbi:mucin-binding protein [Ligilactobacillus salivarius]|uniref:mucin-binding protein n=1 Tax=Ligilactobacillus salivarius TaxID=1624 RepID=UPI003B967F33
MNYLVDGNEVSAPDSVNQEFTFSRDVFTDTITGDVTYGNWNVDNTSFEAVDSPSLKGYTPDLKSVTALTVTPDTKDTVITVTYTKNPIVTSTENKTVKRTINYLVDGNEVSAPDSVNQEFIFSRDVFTDTVTGDVTYGNWNVDNTSFEAVDSPSLKGYTPDLKSVAALTVTPDTKDTVITVTYTKNPVEVQPTPKPTESVDSNKTDPADSTNTMTKHVNSTTVTAKSQIINQVVPSQPVTKSKKLPQTGEEHNSLATIGLLILSLATGLGLKKRKKINLLID